MNIAEGISRIAPKFRQLLNNVGKMGFFHLLSANFFIQLVTFSSGLFVAWILTPEQIGQIKVLQTYSGVAIIIAGLGFNTSVLKICSEKRLPGEKQFLYNRALRYTLFSIAISYALFSLAAYLGIASNDDTINNLLPFFFIALIPNTINYLQMAYIQALKRIKELAKIQSLTKILSVAFIIGLTYFFNIEGFIASTIISGFLTLVMMLRKTTEISESIKPIVINKPFSIHWFFAKYSFLANALGNVSMYLDIFILNFFITDRTELGYYGFAVTLVMGLRLFTATIQQITSPYFSEKSSDFNEWMRIFKKYNLLFNVFSFLFAIITILTIKPILHFIFSGKYDASVYYFQLLTIVWAIRNLYTLKGVAIWGMGRINVNFFTSLIIFPINATIMYLTIKNFNTIGAAYGSIIGALISNFIIHYSFKLVVRQESKLKPNA